MVYFYFYFFFFFVLFFLFTFSIPHLVHTRLSRPERFNTSFIFIFFPSRFLVPMCFAWLDISSQSASSLFGKSYMESLNLLGPSPSTPPIMK